MEDGDGVAGLCQGGLELEEATGIACGYHGGFDGDDVLGFAIA